MNKEKFIKMLEQAKEDEYGDYQECNIKPLEMKQKYEKLKDNWNKLKEWASNFYNSEEVGWAGCGIRYTLEKMQELEQGSDSDE